MARRIPPARPRLTRRRRAALLAVCAALKRRFGEHVIRMGADFVALPRHDSLLPLSTGSLGLDLVAGGLRRGHINEYAGPEGSGVESLAASALAACQKDGGLGLLIDADGAVDPDALVAMGIDVSSLILSTPTTAREAWAVLTSLSHCGALDVLVLASLPGLLALPRERWDAAPAIGVRSLDRRFGRVQWALHGRSTALLLINRPVRQFSAAPMQTIGGPAVARAAALRVLLSPERVVFTPYGDVAAFQTTAHVAKHHGLPRSPHIPLTMALRGPQRGAELVALGRLTGCLYETSLGIVLDDQVLGRSAARAAATIESEPVLAATLEARVRQSWGRRVIAGAGARGVG